MFKVGLTGGIASGKSSVSRWFKKKGITIIDADEIVHELYNRPALINEVEQAFGSAYLENGRVNRALLGSKVFNDPQARDRLEKIIHPLVAGEILDECRAAESSMEQFVIIDIPLLFEAGWERLVDEVWVVYVAPAKQIERLMLRNGLTEKEARARISAQMPLDEKAQKAGRVIDNSGSWEETEKQLSLIWQEIQHENLGKL
ncbi:MAG: dephospho-CoA kinase [Desulfitobacteriia bacterium]|jgi:dephospho-CoA kinase